MSIIWLEFEVNKYKMKVVKKLKLNSNKAIGWD
jgi:hypothetical protein